MEHRQREGQRVRESLTLSNRYGRLKALTVNLSFIDTSGVIKDGQLKYTVNLANAKSVFRFNCRSDECVRGDFDLSAELADAVAHRRKIVAGEKSCLGWQNKTTIDSVHCHNMLRYKLSLSY